MSEIMFVVATVALAIVAIVALGLGKRPTVKWGRNGGEFRVKK